MRLFIQLTLVVLSATPCCATATDMTVFGLNLASDFSVPECRKESYGYSIHVTEVCFERLFGKVRETGPIGTDSVRIRFPVRDSPSLVRGGELLAQVIDAKLEGVSFNTHGTSEIDRVLASLKQKYGEPSALQPRKLQNRLGATFDSTDAVWNLPDLEVLFQGASGRIDILELSATSMGRCRCRRVHHRRRFSDALSGSGWPTGRGRNHYGDCCGD
jgi:hypothetical protein